MAKDPLLSLHGDWLQSFLAVVEQGSFHRAAEALSLSQPALTRQVKQLEERLGFSLFERDRRGTKLTEAGRIYLEEIRPLLGNYAKILEHCQEHVELQLRVGVGQYTNPFLWQFSGLDIVSAVQTQYPHLHVKLVHTGI